MPVMRLGELYDAKVRSAAGKRLGRVHEIIVEDGQVTKLGVGAANILERLFARRHGRHIAWEKVKKIEGGTIVVED
jgi:sporulation protein YlmC with PRC-barrel domain